MTSNVAPARGTCRGFTLVEILVALSIVSIVMALIIASVFTLRNTYFADIKRTQINGNLRSAMDIISMNVRQAGENLAAAFPAVLLTDGASGAADTLVLRRSPITEILTLCADASIGDTNLVVSSASLSNAECIPSNVSPLHAIFKSALAASENAPRVFIYNSALRVGEFVDYEDGDIDGDGNYFLTVGATTNAYTKLSTSIYIIEEYRFSINAVDTRLELTINQEPDGARPVAFEIVNFQASLDMEDGTTISEFAQLSTTDWKDIRQISLQLSGRDTYKGKVISSTITSKFFPRNVLSYEGG